VAEPNAHDEAPSMIVDHPYTPRGEWWSLCEICSLARAAHSSSTPESIEAMQAHFQTLRRASPNELLERERDRGRIKLGSGKVRIGYVDDDDDDDDD
jgi:hypothetical protein